jgi:hypothetical protein
MLIDPCLDLRGLISTDVLSHTKLFSVFDGVVSVVEWKLSHDVISKLDIKDMIVFSSWKY